jgi:serpin B
MRWLLTLTLTAGLVALAVPARGFDKAKAAQPDTDQVVQGNNAFAFDLYGQLRAEKGNLFFSPYSISTALAMTYAGARADTETEMAKTLHFSLGQDKLHRAFHRLNREVVGGEKKRYKLVTANALWGQQGYKFLPAFLKVMQDDYDGGLRQVDFVNATEPARQAINAWVEKQTKEKVKDLIPKGVLTDLTRLVLTNAIYFKAGWQSTFDERSTHKADFHLGAGKTVSVPMMTQTAEFPHLREKDFAALELPYRDNELSMVILLPGRRDGLAAFEKGLTAGKVDGLLKRLRATRVAVSLPRFEVTSQFKLNDALQSLGMRTAFIPRGANFSGMDGKDKKLFLQAVMHKAYVKVNEQGTEAAGATAVVIGQDSLPPQFRADHPFVFLIRHKATGSILFLGRVSEPK